ncbi:uncharacterized protein LOC126985611 [Eriocheir sinensis]|uniref:uncharacterized protein LOC126985611 n=1 Tax=Eriocheir sinensis TaxID=95602 RepID=UPI0021C99288|nr:uncharacterized protein LOC126985611 [Eriocheir sinensis]
MLLGQDLPGPLPTYASYRVLVATWMVFSLVLGTVYRGNLTAAMTLPKYPKRIETVQELVKGVDRINMPPYGADHKESYKRSGSRVLRAVGELIQIVETIEGIGRALKNRREAHADDLHYLQQVTTQDYTSRGGKELLYVGKQNIFASPSAWPVPHDAPYTDHINHVMLRVIEASMRG